MQRVTHHLMLETGWELTTMSLNMNRGKGSAWIRFSGKSRGFEFSLEGNPAGYTLQPQHLKAKFA